MPLWLLLEMLEFSCLTVWWEYSANSRNMPTRYACMYIECDGRPRSVLHHAMMACENNICWLKKGIADKAQHFLSFYRRLLVLSYIRSGAVYCTD